MPDNKPPTAKSIAHRDGRPIIGTAQKLRGVAVRRGLASMANNTKWDELLTVMRGIDRTTWVPENRFKLIVSDHISDWDSEWQHHLPYPFMSVEWLDLTTRSYRNIERLPRRVEEANHTTWVTEVLSSIGLDFLVGRHMVRVFGYSPRDLTGFDELPPSMQR